MKFKLVDAGFRRNMNTRVITTHIRQWPSHFHSAGGDVPNAVFNDIASTIICTEGAAENDIVAQAIAITGVNAGAEADFFPSVDVNL